MRLLLCKAWVGGLLLASVLLSSCGGSEELPFQKDLVPVSGTILMDGKPLAEAGVIFIPTGATGQQARGATDADGRYELTSLPTSATRDDPDFAGAVPGEYDVVISKEAMPDGSPVPEDVEPMDSGAIDIVPPAYRQPGKLKATISATGTNTFDFEIPKSE